MSILWDDGYCASYQQDAEGHYTATYCLTAKVNTNYEQCLTAMAQLPIRGSSYNWGIESFTNLRVETRGINRNATGHYVASLNYSTRMPESENPIDWTPEISWDATSEEVALFRDLSDDAKPIRNAVGDPPDPGLLHDNTILLLNYARWEPSYSQARTFEFNNTINDESWLGFPRYTAKCLSIKAEYKQMSVNEVPIWLWFVGYSFAFRHWLNKEGDEVGWLYLCDDEGFNQKVNTPGGYVKKPILVGGKPAMVPQPLNDAGEPCAIGEEPNELTFQRNYSADFSQLGIVLP